MLAGVVAHGPHANHFKTYSYLPKDGAIWCAGVEGNHFDCLGFSMMCQSNPWRIKRRTLALY